MLMALLVAGAQFDRTVDDDSFREARMAVLDHRWRQIHIIEVSTLDVASGLIFAPVWMAASHQKTFPLKFSPPLLHLEFKLVQILFSNDCSIIIKNTPN